MNVNPLWQDAFKTDLVANLGRKSNNFTKQLYIIDIRIECIMYSCEMCLHYYNTGAFTGYMPGTIENVTYNVCVAANSLVREFGEQEWDIVIEEVRNKLRNPSMYSQLQEEVNRYYRNL